MQIQFLYSWIVVGVYCVYKESKRNAQKKEAGFFICLRNILALWNSSSHPIKVDANIYFKSAPLWKADNTGWKEKGSLAITFVPATPFPFYFFLHFCQSIPLPVSVSTIRDHLARHYIYVSLVTFICQDNSETQSAPSLLGERSQTVLGESCVFVQPSVWAPPLMLNHHNGLPTALVIWYLKHILFYYYIIQLIWLG